jgi:hypothetical protein
LDLLPYDVVHELLGSIESEVNQAPVVEKTTIDLRPVLSVYNDFTTIETKKDAIIEYIKNYFTVNLGDYPFDPTFGTRLKEYLNTLDTPTQQLLISNEVSGLVKLQVKGGAANPSPPVGPALGQYGINISQFCREFNDLTKNFE